MVHTQGQAAPGLGAGGSECRLESLGDRLQGRETIADLHRMDAHAAGVEMIHCREHPDPALFHRLDTSGRQCPTFVRAIRGDGPRVQSGDPLRAAMRREELVLAHQAQHTRAGGTDIAQDRSLAQTLR